MNHKHLPFIIMAMMAAASIAAGCGSDDPDEVTPVTPVDSTDTISEDTIPEDTIPEDTDTVEIPVDSTIYVKWTASGATVEVADELADQFTYEVSAGNVVLTNANVSDEFLFVLSGSSDDGSFTYNGEYKASFQLNGLQLTSTTGAAVDIQCGKRIKLYLAEGTTNTFADAATGTHKAAFNCQGHLEVSGAGTLNIEGNCNHALRSKEYLQLKSSTGTINITKAVADGIHCGEYLLMSGGSVSISGTGSDGLQVETDATSTEELNGQLIMQGGSINITMSAEDAKAIRLDADATDATITPHMQLLDGTVTVSLSSTANGSKGLASDGNLTIGSASTKPTVDITVAGATFTDSAGEENRATGIKADLTLTIAGGATTVKATGQKSRGVRATTLTATGGTLTVTNTGSKSQGIKLDNTFQSGQGGTVSGSFKY